MGIETAFLFGVIVGQWLMIWAIYRAVIRLTKLITTRNTNPPDYHDIIDLE